MVRLGVLRASAVMLSAALLVTGCGNSVYGPRRVVQAGYLDSGHKRLGDGIEFQCQQPQTVTADKAAAPTPSIVDNNGINLVYEFNRLACSSINARTDSNAAAAMMDAGFTLTRLRCNDFFAQRAAGQTRGRILRGAIAPISALLTSLIGVINIADGMRTSGLRITDGERADAIQLLGITQAATIAGFELYEQEFLFDAANINSVRRLVMKALDAHNNAALAAPITGFHHGVRHLTDNQMICTPASILELVRTSIAQGEVVAIQNNGQVQGRQSNAAALIEQLARVNISQSLGVSTLTDDQLGALWWLNQGGLSQDELAVIADRLGILSPPPLAGTAGALTVSINRAAQGELAKLSPQTVEGFAQTVANLRSAIDSKGQATAVAATNAIRFGVGGAAPGGSIDVTAAPAG